MSDLLLKRTLKDIAVYLPGKFIPALTSLITLPIIARLFPPEEYGVLAVIGVFTSLLGIALTNWLTSSALRFLPYYRRIEQLDRFYATLLISFLLSCAVVLLLGVLFVFFASSALSPQVMRLMPIAGLTILFSSLFIILQTLLRAEQRAKAFISFELYTIYSALGLGLVLVIGYGYGVEGFLWGTVFSTVSASLMVIVLYRRAGVRAPLSAWSKETLHEFAAYGLPGLASTLGTWILSVSDRYLIELFRGTNEVGLYSMAYNLGERSVGLFISALVLAGSPILINTWESKWRGETALLLGQLTRVALILLAPVVAGAAALAAPLMAVFTSPAYSSASPVMFWVALGSAIYGMSLLAYTGLNLAKRMTLMARNYLLAGSVNIILNIIFVPAYGYMAAAINTSVSFALLLVINVHSATPYLPWIFPWSTMLRSFLAAPSMGVIIWWLSSQFQKDGVGLLVCIPLGALVYALLLLALGELNRAERQTILGLLRRISPVIPNTRIH